MNICTITCHDVYNAGASLQAYALVTYLNREGHTARVIDYKPDYLCRHFPLWTVANPRYDKPVVRLLYRLAKLPGRLIKRYGRGKKRYDAFKAQYLPLTKRYDSYEALENDPPAADLYIAGSDQIWNTAFPNGRDPAFYLLFAPQGAVRVSYAASFAADQPDPACAAEQAARIRTLDAVSVRERNGLSVLRSLGIGNGCRCVDPVLLLDADTWRSLIPPTRRKNGKPYVFVYDYEGSPTIRHDAQVLADRYGLDIYTVFHGQRGAKRVRDIGPCEFIGLIDNAAYVLSSSFHAIVFSLVLHKPFMAYDRTEDLNSRMHDLIAFAGFEGRTAADEPIDWAAFDDRLGVGVSESEAYLKRVTSHELL